MSVYKPRMMLTVETCSETGVYHINAGGGFVPKQIKGLGGGHVWENSSLRPRQSLRVATCFWEQRRRTGVKNTQWILRGLGATRISR